MQPMQPTVLAGFFFFFFYFISDLIGLNRKYKGGVLWRNTMFGNALHHGTDHV